MIGKASAGSMGRGKTFVLSVAALVILAILFAVWYGLWQRMQKKDREDSLPGAASTTAGMLIDARRYCASAGIGPVDDCARSKSEQGQEQAAQMLASAAVGSRDNYFAYCGEFHDRRFCSELLAHEMGDDSTQSRLLVGN